MKKFLLQAGIFTFLFIFIFSFQNKTVIAQNREDTLKLIALQDAAGKWDNGKGTKVHVYYEDLGESGVKVYADMEKLIYTGKNGCTLESYTEKNMTAAFDLSTIDATSIQESQMYCGKDKNNKHFYKKVWWVNSGHSKIKQPMLSFFSKKDGYIHFNYHEGYLQTSGHYEYPVPMKRITKEGPINNISNQNNNQNNNEIITGESQFIINLYNQNNSTIFTSPGENSSCKLQADVDCSNPAEKSGRKIKMEIVNEKIGSFSPAETNTGSDGKAYFTYTAPAGNLLNGKDKIDVQIKAVDVKTGEFSVITISILNRNSATSFTAAYEIMPHGEKFYNELRLFINAPPKGNGYNTTISTKDVNGLITLSKNDAKGNSPVSDLIKPGQEYKFYYHNTNNNALDRAIDDEVTIEIPEINFKKTINISVGMDLTVTGITRKGKGTIYPGLAEPLEVHIADNFHPGSDLEKIFTTFELKPKLKLTLIDYDQNNKLYYSDDDIASKILSYAEGYFLKPDIATPTAEYYFSIARKTNENTYVLVDKMCIERKDPDIYPAIYFLDRGNYVFKAELYDVEFYENNTNNSSTINLTVDEYRDETDELLKKAYIPCAKYMFGLWGVAKEGTWEGMKLVGKVMSGVDMAGQWSKIEHIKESIQKGDLKEALVGTYGFFTNFIDDSKYGKNVKLLLQYNTLAMTVKDLVGGIVALKNNEGGGQIYTAKDISNKLIYPQLLVKGSNKHFVIVIDKAGIKNYTAKLKDGSKLLSTPDKLKNGKEITERIEESDEYIFIPAEINEEINMVIDFTGTGGYIYRITKDKIEKIEFPKTSSGKIIISSNNVLTFGKQESRPENKSVSFAGSWETNEFGSISFVIVGSDVVGTCSKNLGGMKGTISSDGTKITGKWSRFPTYSSPKDAGKFEITISNDGKSFSGKYCNGTDDKTKSDKSLNGKKK